MVPVTSATLTAIGYEEQSQTLRVEFTSGAVYEYYDVPAVIHEELMSAASIGRYLGSNIKGQYRYSRV
jgi:hypothetical protein